MTKAFSPSTLKYGNKPVVRAQEIIQFAQRKDRKGITDMIGQLPRKHRHLILSNLDKIIEIHGGK